MSATVLAFDDPRPDPARNGPTDVRALSRALDGEAKLLNDLLVVLERQRDAVAADDLEQVDATVFDAQRILLSLGQARRRRRALLGLAAGNEGLPLGELHRLLGDAMDPELASAIDRVTGVADRVQRQMSLNRQILSGAIRAGDELLRALGTGGKKPAAYSHPTEAPAPGPAGGLLLNRQV